MIKKYAIGSDSILNIFVLPHHADSTKIVFSIKGTWNTQASISNNSISGSYVNLNVSDIIDKRFRNSSDIKDKKTATSKRYVLNTCIFCVG